MDIKSGKKHPAGALSNFSPHPFKFRGLEITSMEGFLQGLKIKSPEVQAEMFKRVGLGAKRAGSKYKWQKTQTLWWQGNPIKRDSQEYQDILDEAYVAMFTQNKKARKALLATGDAVLKHSIGRSKQNETVLTRREFCSRLMEIRSVIRMGRFIDI